MNPGVEEESVHASPGNPGSNEVTRRVVAAATPTAPGVGGGGSFNSLLSGGAAASTTASAATAATAAAFLRPRFEAGRGMDRTGREGLGCAGCCCCRTTTTGATPEGALESVGACESRSCNARMQHTTATTSTQHCVNDHPPR